MFAIPCGGCKHFDLPESAKNGRAVCAAFPAGIPNEIYSSNDIEHLTPYPGDHGIQYEEAEWLTKAKAKHGVVG